VKLFCALVLLALLGPLHPAAAAAASAAVPTIDVEGIRTGQKAVVEDRLRGRQVEEFEAEIVGVLHSGRVEGDMILARATSERVLRTGVGGRHERLAGLRRRTPDRRALERLELHARTAVRRDADSRDAPGARSAVQAEPAGTAGPTGAEIGRRPATSPYGEFRWSDPGPGDRRRAQPSLRAVAARRLRPAWRR
jgi:hypothetical protein